MIQVTKVILKSLQGTAHPWTPPNWGGRQGKEAAESINSFNKHHKALSRPALQIRQQTRPESQLPWVTRCGPAPGETPRSQGLAGKTCTNQ